MGKAINFLRPDWINSGSPVFTADGLCRGMEPNCPSFQLVNPIGCENQGQVPGSPFLGSRSIRAAAFFCGCVLSQGQLRYNKIIGSVSTMESREGDHAGPTAGWRTLSVLPLSLLSPPSLPPRPPPFTRGT